MKAASAIGIVIACLCIVGAGIMEGVAVPSLLNIPALIIVLGGTAGAIFAGVGMRRFMLVPKLYMKAFSSGPPDLAARVETLVSFAERARKDGLLALEEEIEGIDDAFMRKGMQLVVDGSDPDLLREILDAEIDGMAARHKEGSSVFEKAGGLAPTIGVLGTVVSLIHVLGNLSAPETLGPAISGAFIATLYGVGSANIVYFPVCYTLQMLSAKEVEERTLIVEGILAIQAGDNPRIVQQKLLSFIPPAERDAVENAGQKKPDLKIAEAAEPAAQAA
jgi:chemotaxis protein MotA